MDAALKFTDEQAETSFADTVSGDSVLTIPLFQRPYRWTKQNFDWFLQDVEEIREGAAQSEFMGVVVAVQRGVRAGRPIPFEIVDGQQRLSTIYLFVTAAIEVIAKSGETTEAANLMGTYLLVRRMADNPINTKLVPSFADREQFKGIWDRVMAIPGFSSHPDVQAVRRQSFWVQRPRDLSEYLAHLVGFIMRRTCGDASAGFRVFCV